MSVSLYYFWIPVVRGGKAKLSLRNLIIYFEDGLLHHGDLAETLQAFYLARAELRSEDRDGYIEHLERIGKYESVGFGCEWVHSSRIMVFYGVIPSDVRNSSADVERTL